jgi:hypothetical protein
MLRKLALAFACLFALAASAQQATAPAAPDAVAAPRSPKPRHVSQRNRIRAQQVFMQGAKDLERDHPRAAMAAFTRAAQLDPGESRYAVSISVARQRLVYDLVQQAEKAKALGDPNESLADILQAYHLDPDDPFVAEHVDELAAAASAPGPSVPSTAVAPPVTLEPKAGLRSFHIRTNERTLIEQICAAYGIHPTIDDSVGAQIVPYNVDNVDFQQAENILGLATNTFFVPLDPVRVLVAKDTRENRTKFERLAMETFYVPGLTNEEQTELASLARQDFAAKAAFADAGESAITVRAPVEDLTALNATLGNLLEGRSQLELDVVMYEVDRTKATDIGAVLPTETTLFNVYSEANSILQQNSSLVQEIISSGLVTPGPTEWEQILAVLIGSGQVSSSLFSNFATFGGGLTLTGLSLNGGTANMQLNSTDVHSVDQIQLRVLDQEEGTIKVGERYPIVTSSFGSTGSTPSISGISSAGLSSELQNLGISASELEAAETEVVPQVQYQDIGLTLDVTPRIHTATALSLKFSLKLSSLGGTSSIEDIPILDNREYQAITTLHVGESAVLMSSLSRQQSDAISGIPGLSDLPGFQDATNKNSNLNYSELVIVITPHLVRYTHPETAERMFLVPPAQ